MVNYYYTISSFAVNSVNHCKHVWDVFLKLSLSIIYIYIYRYIYAFKSTNCVKVGRWWLSEVLNFLHARHCATGDRRRYKVASVDGQSRGFWTLRLRVQAFMNQSLPPAKKQQQKKQKKMHTMSLCRPVSYARLMQF